MCVVNRFLSIQFGLTAIRPGVFMCSMHTEREQVEEIQATHTRTAAIKRSYAPTHTPRRIGHTSDTRNTLSTQPPPVAHTSVRRSLSNIPSADTLNYTCSMSRFSMRSHTPRTNAHGHAHRKAPRLPWLMYTGSIDFDREIMSNDNNLGQHAPGRWGVAGRTWVFVYVDACEDPLEIGRITFQSAHINVYLRCPKRTARGRPWCGWVGCF